MIDFSLTPTQKDLQAEIIAFAQANLNEGVAERDQQQAFRKDLWKQCGQIGLTGLCIPKAFGGRGLQAVDTVIALEALGYGSEDAGLNFALAAHLLACLVPMNLYGTETQKKEWLPDLCNGNKIASNAMTESTSGSAVYEMATTATLENDHYIINGHKSYCSNGPVADVVLTYAMTTPEKGFFGGISAFVLQKEKHTFDSSAQMDKLGLRTCPLSELYFENTKVAASAMLGKAGAGGVIFQQSMEWERICLGALHLGAMDRLMKKAIGFAKGRTSSGLSIGSFQAVTHPLVDLQCRIDAARQLTYKAAWKLDHNEKVAKEAAMAKLMTSETYKAFAIQINQLYAGAAFKSPNETERCLRDAMAATVYSGTSEVQRNIIARYMGLK